jgi:branched-chain amino acid transport system ATP-binding protein
MLQIEKLSVSYGVVQALHNVSLRVEEGEIVTIIGSNGAGKSSLMRAISGLVPTSGTITLQGESIVHVPPYRRVKRGIAHVPEGRHVFPDQTVEDNLSLGAYARHLSHATTREEMQSYYDMFPRLRERSTQYAGTLSGGEQQMLAIGRALMSRPKLLLLDEPSLGLAPLIVADIFRIVRQLRSKGMTILLVEQMARQALAVSDRAYVLETGRVVLEGSGVELLHSQEVRRAYLGIGGTDSAY